MSQPGRDVERPFSYAPVRNMPRAASAPAPLDALATRFRTRIAGATGMFLLDQEMQGIEALVSADGEVVAGVRTADGRSLADVRARKAHDEATLARNVAEKSAEETNDTRVTAA